MQVLKQITHPHYKLTLYEWNNRYIIKLEQDLLEQTFKINKFDVAHEGELEKLLNPDFMQQAMQRFAGMSEALHKALQAL